MKYYIVVGEPSGDLHASKMMAAIKAKDPDAIFRFFGGDKMVEVAGSSSLAMHYKEASFMGLWRVLANLGKILSQIKYCKEDIDNFAPDLVILVDYAGFNLRIAEYAKSKGYRVNYYIAPKVWAWKRSRIKKIKKYVDKLFVIFPFEVEYFTSRGIETYYDGNPIMDAIEEGQGGDITLPNGLTKDNTIALLCGSRLSEIRDNLPYMVKLASHFPSHTFVVAAVSWIDMSVYKKIVADAPNVTIVTDKTYALLKSSCAAVVTSGTATLETALIATPQLVCYWVGYFSSLVGMMLVKIRFVSLVNIIMDREVVKELVFAYRMTIPSGVKELAAILPGGSKRDAVLDGYAKLRELVGESGASQRTGERMVELLKRDTVKTE